MADAWREEESNARWEFGAQLERRVETGEDFFYFFSRNPLKRPDSAE
jgi:hypothetical protein